MTAAGVTLLALTGGILSGETRPAQAAGAPVLVELFTSQGCSSCPSADAFLKELAGQPDILALSFHVDYWDRLGWRDPFASAWNTRRQYAYREALGQPYVFTPQMVIDGTGQAVGSDRAAVGRLIDRHRHDTAAVVVGLERATSDQAAGDVVPGAARLVLPAKPGLAGRLTLFGYDREHGTEVRAGENTGRRLLNTNVVTLVEDWGPWSGEPVDRIRPLPDPKPGRSYALVLVQEGGTPATRVLGAARLEVAPR